MYESRTTAVPTPSENLATRAFDHSMNITWIGLNAFAHTTDPALPVALSAYGESMRLRGDGALLACAAQQIVAWVWVRTGPYLECAGAGFLEIPQSTHVVRDFKVHPDLRRRGLGRRILAELARRFFPAPSTRTIAFIAPHNVPSIRAFERVGFTRVATVDTRRIAGIRLVTKLPLGTATCR